MNDTKEYMGNWEASSNHGRAQFVKRGGKDIFGLFCESVRDYVLILGAEIFSWKTQLSE